MTSFFSSFADRHFAEKPRQSLLAGLAARIDVTNLISALSSGCRPLQHLAWRRMAELSESQLTALVEPWLRPDPDSIELHAVTAAVLNGLAHETLPVSEAILARVVSLMESSSTEVRLAAATVVALRQPVEAIALLRRGDPIDRDVLRRLCLTDDPALIVPLMTAFGFPQTPPPPTIGFVAAPVWLADAHARAPQLVEWLIRHCGYCDDEVTAEVVNLLSSGFSYVTTRMTSEPRMTKIAHRWQRRIRAFTWRLLPGELELQPDDTKPFDVADPLDVDLFLAAVRDSDRMLFFEQKSRPPFDRARVKREPAPVCFHAPSRYVRRRFVAEPLALAERWNIPHDRRGDFVIEQARVLLEPNDEARLAADLALRGKWNEMSDRSKPAVGWALLPVRRNSRPRSEQAGRAGVPILQGARSDIGKHPTRDGNLELPATDERLSPGANSVVALAAACGLNGHDIANWLAEAEARWSRCLVPIGIEVQIPCVDPNHFAAWKAALPFLGVPSPIRPEFGGMVEAAFRPARSFHALVLGPLLLSRLGLIAEPQDLALHLSLQGDLGDGVRSLAFPHLFIHPSQRLRNRPDGSMARVMSKGLVHVHEDAEAISRDALSPTNVITVRTELRLFRIFAESHENVSGHAEIVGQQIELSRTFISDIMAVQILGSALVSDCRHCRELFAEYAAAIEQATHELPSEFHPLLASNYFESTGDPRDEVLLNLLPIFRRWSSVRQLVRDRDLSTTLDLRFRTLRHQHVQLVLKHWSDEHGLNTAEVRFTNDDIQLTLPSVMN